MAMTSFIQASKKRGIALLVTLIFMSVMLAFGLALASLAYKQAILASDAIQSQKAFYAADGALECALYFDQRAGDFIYDPGKANLAKDVPDGANGIATLCGGTIAGSPNINEDTVRLTVSERLNYNGVCADLVIYKYPQTAPPAVGAPVNYLYSTGYNVPCAQLSQASAGGRVVVRGIYQRY